MSVTRRGAPQIEGELLLSSSPCPIFFPRRARAGFHGHATVMASVLFLSAAAWSGSAWSPLPTPRAASCRLAESPIANVASPSFADLYVSDEVCTALEAIGITKPNVLQAEAIPAIAGRTNLVLGAQTGSGKTLTYLIPVMSAIKADEAAGRMRAKPRRPRAIVLVPTRELALQVHETAKLISHHLKLSVSVVHGGVPDAPQLKRLQNPTDVLVATPGRLIKLMDLGGLYLGDVRHVVMDEVDTMFEAGFGDELERILSITTRDLAADSRQAEAAAQGMRVQHVAVGATHPEKAQALYASALPGAKPMLLEDMHTAPPTLKQEFVTCNGPDAKGRVAAL